MQTEDQYLDRTTDLVAKVRAMREAAEKQMNRFTKIDDYDVRCVVGRNSKSAPGPSEANSPDSVSERAKRSAAKSTTTQTSIDFEDARDEENV
jgi:hypothetical protein